MNFRMSSRLLPNSGEASQRDQALDLGDLDLHHLGVPDRPERERLDRLLNRCREVFLVVLRNPLRPVALAHEVDLGHHERNEAPPPMKRSFRACRERRPEQATVPP